MPVISVTVLKSICPIVNRKRYWAFLPAVLFTAAVAYLSLTESAQAPSVALNDKFLHAAFYTVLAIAWFLPIVKHSPFAFRLSTYVVLGVTAYGAFLELLQHFCTLTRSGEWLDLLADFIGALIGVIIIAIITIVNQSSTRKSSTRQ